MEKNAGNTLLVLGWTLIEHCKRSGCSTPHHQLGGKNSFSPTCHLDSPRPLWSSFSSQLGKKLGMFGDNADQFVSF